MSLRSVQFILVVELFTKSMHKEQPEGRSTSSSEKRERTRFKDIILFIKIRKEPKDRSIAARAHNILRSLKIYYFYFVFFFLELRSIAARLLIIYKLRFLIIVFFF
jgi:hypothetical protein